MQRDSLERDMDGTECDLADLQGEWVQVAHDADGVSLHRMITVRPVP